MKYVLIDAEGTPFADPDSGTVFTFDTIGEARSFAKPGERVAGAVRVNGPAGAWKTVPLPAAERDR
jgi:hypothetical protein